MRHHQRTVGAFAAVCAALTTMVAGPISTPSASAATTTLTARSTVIGSTTVTGVALTDTALGGVAISAGDLGGTISWSQPTTVSTQYDTDAVRQGRSLDPVDAVSRSGAGQMVANVSLAGLKVGWLGVGPFDVGTVSFGATGTCSLLFGGGDYVCHLESANQTILDTAPLPGPFTNAKLVADLTITPGALATLRTASSGGTIVGTNDLALGETPVTDPLALTCDANAGDAFTYTLGSMSTTPGITMHAALALEVGASVVNPAYPASSSEPLLYQPLATPSFAFAPYSTSMTLTRSGATFPFGTVQADDQQPVAHAGGPYVGIEGAPIAFDGSASTGGCAVPTLHWALSDGGAGDGPNPSHTFADDGTYTGTLTATANGQSDTASFSVVVGNAPPSADAGSDVSTGVGTPVAFTGTATDPSSVDQASLSYSWDFGDASPPAATSSATHAYSASGTYDATLTVCDKDGACDSDVRRVSVGARQRTLLVYFGDFIGRPHRNADMRAILVDKKLHPLAGRTVVFDLAGQTVAATTDARGVATTTLRVATTRGWHRLTASWTPTPGDGAYAGASITVPFLVLPR